MRLTQDLSKLGALSTVLHIPRRPENIIVDSLLFNHGFGDYTCSLTLNEKHEYFFDHDLDHVPGVFLNEGILQAIETIILNDAQTNIKYNEFYVRRVKLQFSSFCEKNLPISLNITTGKIGMPLLAMNVVVKQEGKFVCKGNVEVCCSEIDCNISSIKDRHVPVKADNAAVHKSKDENIMVSPIVDCEPEGYCSDIIALPDKHIMMDGNQNIYSIQCLFEAVKQFVTQSTHKVKDVPFDSKMILLSFDIALYRPAYRSSNLKLFCRNGVLWRRSGQMRVIRIIMADGTGELGECKIMGKIEDEETYYSLRWKDNQADERKG